MQSWSLGLLCFNEEESIELVLDKCYEVLPQMTDDFELIVVNDGSTDNSLAILKRYKEKNNNLIIIDHSKNKGIGAALHSAYDIVTKDNVLITCGDGQFDVNELIPFKSFPSKTVLAFYRKDNRIYSIQRNILSAFNKLFNKYFLGFDLYDVNWAKVYKREELDLITTKMKSSLVESEICSKLYCLGNEFKQIESEYLDRVGGVSKGSSFLVLRQAILEMFYLAFEILKFRIKLKFKKKKD